MIIDSLLEFSKGQVVATTALSDNKLNMFVNGSTNAEVNLGVGEPVAVVVKLAEGSPATGTLTVELLTSDDPTFGTSTTLATSGAKDLTKVKNGDVWAVPLPSGGYKKYLALKYTGAAKVNAFIVKDFDANIAYKTKYEIL